MNPSTAQARVLADEFARGGLCHTVIAPGSRSAPLALAFDAHPDVTVHVEIDERSAAFLALGIGRASRQPAAVVCSSGTAAVNFHPAVVEAHHSRTPLVVLTADRPPELRATGANQTIDQPGVYGGVTRWSVDISVAERRAGAVAYWRSIAARALAEARGHPAGPVHCNVGLREPLVPDRDDDWIEPLDGIREAGQPWATRTVDLGLPVPSLVAEAAGLVDAHPRGALVLGDVEVDGVVVAGFATVAGWPVIAEPHSGARTGDHVVSTADLLLADPGFADAHRPDVAVVIGRPVLTRSVRRWLDGVPRTVVVDADGAWLDPGRTVERIVRADPTALLHDVTDRLDGRRTTHFLAQWQHAERSARAAVDAVLDERSAPTEPRVARDLAACLPDGSALVAASSMPIRDLSAVMRPRRGLRVLGNRGASGIDGFVSTTLGVAIGHDGPVASLCGDLSLLHDQNGFLLADAAELDAVFVVVNNDGGGIFSLLEQREVEGFERLFGTPHGIAFASLAALYGVAYHPLPRAADLADTVCGALDLGGLHLVEVRTDRDANAALHRELSATVAAVLQH
ncbi:MAG TPA: 2-succinyl-5-enolpyruvyl-6-hydroxy-3-cyclohexene-1-carboxylic-acid synthase [Euzebyales bacterium]|nr:2-succinyl-5-enolpyruvyl-6-hydroxy-3-cyclohexene-1-carboxylic-acid synthase [Euzebyales bacterium]